VAINVAAAACSEARFLRVTTVTFFKFLLNPYFDLEPDWVIRKPIKRRFQRFQQYLVCTKIFSTFDTQIEYISRRTIRHSAYSNEWGRKCQKNPETAPSPWGTWTPIPHINAYRPTPLTTPNNSSIALRTSAQLRNKSPIGYNGTTQLHPQNWCPIPSTITIPSNTPIPRPTPLTTPNGIRIQSSVLPQYTLWTDRPTYRQAIWARCVTSSQW